MPESRVRALSRRRFLGCASAGAAAFVAGPRLSPLQGGPHAQVVHTSGHVEVLVVTDGHFVLPTAFLLAPDAPAAERDAVLKAARPSEAGLQLPNNVVVIRAPSALVLIDAGSGPRHQPTAGKLAAHLEAAGIRPAAITMVVLTHAHPDHVWGVLDARDALTYPNATYAISAREWDLWSDPDVRRTLPAVLANDRIVSGATSRLARIKDKVRMVRGGEEITGGVRVLETRGHTSGHISLEVAGGDGLVIGADALTHPLISFQHPSWKVPVDQEADHGITTRLRLLDRLATDKVRLVGAHLPFPGTGFAERKDGAYRFVPA